VSASDRAPLDIALVHHSFGSPPRDGVERIVQEVGAGLRERGHRPTIFASHVAATRRSTWEGIPVVHLARLPESPLARRGFTGPLTHVPFRARALLSGGHDVVHAFSAPDALAARLWRRRVGGPVLFTCAETLGRDRLADRRLRLRLLGAAVEDSDGVLVPTEEARAALWRWLAAEAPLVDPRDGAAHERICRRLLASAER